MVNIKATDINDYTQNKNTPDTAVLDISAQYIKEMRKLRRTTFQNKTTTTSEIENIIKILKPKNLYGYNKIPTKLLKITAPSISSPLN